jgi:hypothetical protein
VDIRATGYVFSQVVDLVHALIFFSLSQIVSLFWIGITGCCSVGVAHGFQFLSVCVTLAQQCYTVNKSCGVVPRVPEHAI